MKIREYKSEDKEQIIEMVSEILECIFNGDPTQFKVLKEFNITKDYVLYLVVEIQGNEKKIVGTMALKKMDKEEVRLKRIYVRKEYRKRGIAQKLLNQLVKFAKESGYKKILLHTYPTMKNAHKFYKKNGFIVTTGKDPEQIHVVKDLTPIIFYSKTKVSKKPSRILSN